jgi:chromate reductase, NAD(P)H dehydrogenase (quinone)
MKFFLLAGSLRQESVNKTLIRLCAKLLKNEAHEVDLTEMQEFEVPLYNQDEQNKNGIPAGALRMIERMDEADGIIFSVPEYNFSVSGVFKNQIDWISRKTSKPWDGKRIALVSASPSLVGGNRGLWATRVPLECCGALVYPHMFSLASAYTAFKEDGSLQDASLQQRLQQLLIDFANLVGKIKIA